MIQNNCSSPWKDDMVKICEQLLWKKSMKLAMNKLSKLINKTQRNKKKNWTSEIKFGEILYKE